MKKYLFYLATLLTSILILVSSITMATTRYAVANGNWSSINTWSATSTGSGGASVPVAGDTVFINDGINVTVTADAACASLTINSGPTPTTITISGSNSLTISGALSLGNGTDKSSLRTFAVGSGTISCNSITMGKPNPNNSGATLTISSGTVTVSGNITMSGSSSENSIVFSGAGLLNIGGTMSGGSFNAGTSTSTVNYNGAAQTVGSYTYNNLTLSGSGVKTINSVTVNGVLTMAGTATVSAAPTYGNSSSLVYAGSAAQTTGAEFLSTMLRPVTINNSNGVTLNSNKTVNGTLTFTSGNLYTGSYTLTLGSTASLAGEKTDSYLVGKLITTKTVGTSASTMGNIGLSIAAGTTVGNVTVTRISGVAPAGTGHKANRSWAITSTSSASRDLTFLWVSNDDGNVDLNNAIVFLSTNNGTSWTSVSGALDVSSSRSITASGQTLSTSSSLFTIGDATTPLPVELTSFTSSVNANVVTLNWATATEKNNYGFDVERLATGQSWVKIGFVQGAGISNAVKQYSFVDKNLAAGSYSYRLKQIDNDGTFKYLPAIEVSVGAQPVSFSIGNYPNPFNPSTIIRYSLPSNAFVNISIYNMLGQKVVTLVNQNMEQGVHEVSFNASSLATGAYIYRIEAGSYSATKKMLLLK
jgi:hypothetical protein